MSHNKKYDVAYRQTQEHKEKQGQYAKKYYLVNKDKLLVKARELRQKVLNKFGRRCNNPACQWLNLDGTRGCNKERKNLRYTDYYKLVIEDNSGKYQLLCANCNWIKRKEINL